MVPIEQLLSVGLKGDYCANRGGIQLGARYGAKEHRLSEQRKMDREDDRKRIDTRTDPTDRFLAQELEALRSAQVRDIGVRVAPHADTLAD